MYDSHYGLNGRPFQLTPDPRFWFDTATHKKAMAYLGYGLSQGEGFIVITGDIGAGKTTLVGHLVDTVDAARLNVIKIVSTQIAADDLLRTVCAGLDVDATGLTKAQMLSGIERGLHAVARGGRRTLLIVDEAQALPVDSLEELRMLSNFQAGGYALLQIFLLGQPEFRDKLAHAALEQLRQRVIAMHHLGPMEADELAPYLIHRLSVVGWQGRPDFKADALETIFAWSGGIPRRINQLVSRVMLHGAIEGIDTFVAADVMTVVTDLDGDGMTGGAIPEFEREPDAADTPVGDEPVREPLVQDTPILETTVQEIAAVEAPGVAPFVAAPLPDENFAPALPIVAEAPVDDAPTMEWPFTPDTTAVEDHDGGDWRPIILTNDDDAAEPAEAARPSVLEFAEPVAEAEGTEDHAAFDAPVDADGSAAPSAEDTPIATISAPPQMFERFTLRGRRPILAPVDDVPTPDHEPVPAPVSNDPVPALDIGVAARLADIDRRLEEQDVALRRVLTLLVDWVEGAGSRADASAEDYPELRDRAG